MQPSFDLRLRTMIKALSETVLPAIDSSNKAALEQTNIVIGSLELLREQVDFAHWFEVVDAKGMAAMVDTLVAITALPSAAKAREVAAQTLAVAERYDIRLSTLRDANRELRDVISTLIEEAFALDDEGVRKQVQQVVLERSEAQISRERAFVAGTHFDVFPDTLLSIEESLRRAA